MERLPVVAKGVNVIKRVTKPLEVRRAIKENKTTWVWSPTQRKLVKVVV